MALGVGPPGTDLLPVEEEPPLPLNTVTPEELRAHPGLARLLRGLSCALGPDGLNAPLERDLRQAEAALALRRRTWLRWETLWRGVQELRRDPRDLEPPVLQALERALALAELRRGPSAFAPLLPPAQDPSPLRARLLPELERRLAEKTGELSDYHGGGGSPRPPKFPRAPRRAGGSRRAYAEVLGRCGEVLGRLAGQSCAGAQAELDGRRAEYLEVKGAAMLLKIRLEELGVLLDTYPPDKVDAHRRIRAGLEAESERAAAQASGLRAALAAFGELGPEFGALAGEYGRLRERLGHRRWALRQLRPHQP
ncbi:HAUS augmin-like complex subunit 4 [Grus japonensis]|uniref:HAUS augmin-like complex subunit 4 n=1 Tax=Grus japonensis TaxID=30415 RepID=A0ABC9XWY8_GRUJA